jgi:hypothetical protein
MDAMSSVRLWHQSVNELDHLDVYRRTLTQHAVQVLGTDAEVEIHRLPSGVYNGVSAIAALRNAFVYVGARVLQEQAIEPPLKESALAAAYGRLAGVVEAFRRAVEQAVAKGADVIIPADGVLGELRYASGVCNIAGAVVFDVFGATWDYALMLLRLLRSGLRVSRAWHFRRDDPTYVQKIHDRERSV